MSMLDSRGFSKEFNDAVAATIDLLKNDPEQIKNDVESFIVRKSALEDASGKLPTTRDELLTRIAEIYVAGTRDVDLGVALTWDEMKTPDWTVKCRRCYGHCYASYSHPSLDEIWGDVLECSKVAAIAATLGAIWADPGVALPVFKAAFCACLQTKGIKWASEISVSLYTRGECGNWHGCG